MCHKSHFLRSAYSDKSSSRTMSVCEEGCDVFVVTHFLLVLKATCTR